MPVYEAPPAIVQTIDTIGDQFPEMFDPAELPLDADYHAEYAAWCERHDEPYTVADLDAMAAEMGVPE